MIFAFPGRVKGDEPTPSGSPNSPAGQNNLIIDLNKVSSRNILFYNPVIWVYNAV
jgi:hypothetical protein